MKLIELIILIFTVSFVFAVFWQIALEVEEMVWDVDFDDPSSYLGYEDNFVV